MYSHRHGLYFLLALLIGTLVIAYFIFQPFLAPLALAAVFAVVLQPLYRGILSYIPRWPSIASAITVLISVVGILVPLAFIGTQIGLEARNLYFDLSSRDTRMTLESFARQADDTIGAYIPAARGFSTDLAMNISSYAQAALQWIMQNIGTAATSAVVLILKLFIFFVALYYLLRDGSKLRAKIVELSPLNDTYDEGIFDKLALAVNSVIKGNLTIALIQGTLTAIGFALFGVPNAVLWGSVAALAALIPGLGTSMVFIPAVLFMYFTGNLISAFALAIWWVLAVSMIDNLLAPHLIGRGVQLHPLLVLLSVLGGLALFGPAGLFLGPLSLSLLFAFLSIYSEISKRTA